MLLDILDTCSIEEFSAMREQYMKCGQGFILVFSALRRDSFHRIKEYLDEIISLKVVYELLILNV